MKILGQLLHIPLIFLLALPAVVQADDYSNAWMPTPARLSYLDGPVSYWRPDAPDWVGASLNLPVSQGDALYAGQNASFELQIGSRSFVRADEHSELRLLNQDEYFMQFEVTSGLVSFDIRSIADGDTIEVDTPHAVFTIKQPGYYRVDIDGPTTHFITHRGGRAIVTTEDGRSLGIYPSEDIVISADNPSMVATYAAPPPDDWDRWNDERSDYQAESISSRYLPPGIYGADDLDHYGYWRVVPEYGPVWIPNDVGPDWVPYSNGYWVWDPDYEWTWVDNEPWGWAPFHYGRWVSVDGRWCWAPGPLEDNPVYSPALVAFMVRDHSAGININAGAPGLWWVALGWGEPVIPWWGPRGYRGHPHWNGWHGPRVAFNTTDYRYRNAGFPHAVFGAPEGKFGRERFRPLPEGRFRHEDFAPLHGELPVRPGRESLMGGAPRGIEPPRDIINQSVISTHPPREHTLPWNKGGSRTQSQFGQPPKIVGYPPRGNGNGMNLPRPPYGHNAGPERSPQALPPGFGETRKMPRPSPLPAQTQQPVREQPMFHGQVPQGQPQQSRRDMQINRPAPPVPAGGSAVQNSSSQSRILRRETHPRREPAEQHPNQGEVRQQRTEQGLPGQPANRMYRKEDRRELHGE